MQSAAVSSISCAALSAALQVLVRMQLRPIDPTDLMLSRGWWVECVSHPLQLQLEISSVCWREAAVLRLVCARVVGMACQSIRQSSPSCQVSMHANIYPRPPTSLQQCVRTVLQGLSQ